jgi:hypothetical protein
VSVSAIGAVIRSPKTIPMMFRLTVRSVMNAEIGSTKSKYFTPYSKYSLELRAKFMFFLKAISKGISREIMRYGIP